jgi:uncharacterized protein
MRARQPPPTERPSRRIASRNEEPARAGASARVLPRHGLPCIAIVIDDVGLRSWETEPAIALPAPVTLALLPYAPKVQEDADKARAAGHEVFLHLPMEAIGGEDPGPHALRVSMSDDELRREIEHNLSAFRGYVGVNNHMGSRLTSDARAMRVVMQAIHAKGLIFLDSRTTARTVGEAFARDLGVPAASRHVFLDNVLTEESVAGQFSELLDLAAKQKVAVAIGHPHRVTLDFLARVLPSLEGRYEVLPVSATVARRAAAN